MDELRHTQLARQFEWVDDWWRKENTKGELATCGGMWVAHESWKTEQDRWRWHQNLGELLNYHATASIISEQAADGDVRYRLVLMVVHEDPVRLSRVQQVTGGNFMPTDAALHYLRIRDSAAHEAIKAGRLFCDPANKQLFEVFDAALNFRRHVARRGQPTSEQQLTAQEYWRDEVIDRMGAYVRPGRQEHDCAAAIGWAGGTKWGREAVSDPLQDLYKPI